MVVAVALVAAAVAQNRILKCRLPSLAGTAVVLQHVLRTFLSVAAAVAAT